jgi:hypothetical protein
MPHRLVALILCHHCLAFVAVCDRIIAHTHNQICVWEPAVTPRTVSMVRCGRQHQVVALQLLAELLNLTLLQSVVAGLPAAGLLPDRCQPPLLQFRCLLTAFWLAPVP